MNLSGNEFSDFVKRAQLATLTLRNLQNDIKSKKGFYKEILNAPYAGNKLKDMVQFLRGRNNNSYVICKQVMQMIELSKSTFD